VAVLKRAILAVAALAIAAGATRNARADDTLAPHPDAAWWLSGAVDLDAAAQPGFHSDVQGSNSWRADDQTAAVVIASVAAGYAITSITAVVASGEVALGEAFDDGRGVGAPVADDFVRNPGAGATPYLASSFVDQVVPLSHDRVAARRSALNVLRTRPARRLELRAGELFAPDWFDGPQPGFVSGAVAHDAGWEYPADQHGYTAGAILEYADRHVTVRLAELLEPTAPRSSSYDTDLANARAEVAEVTARYCLGTLPGSARLGGYVNRADLGSYGDAVGSFEVGEDEFPDIAAHRLVGDQRVGYLGGVEQRLPAGVTAFAGFAWSDSATESFGAVETDRSARVGARIPGALWGRTADEVGLGAAVGGLTELHRTYLAIGGATTLLGDGKLAYGVEQTTEAYYAARVVPGVSAGAHVEVVARPGFDTLRGPVAVGLAVLRVRL
jgi:high affinity Mn2+ porin